MYSFSLDERTCPVIIEGTPVDHWENLAQGFILPFVEFPVVDGRIGRGVTYGHDFVTGNLVTIEMDFPVLPAHLAAKEPSEEVVGGEWQELPRRREWGYGILLGVGLLFLLWLKQRISYE
jgi:hypothetical protein